MIEGRRDTRTTIRPLLTSDLPDIVRVDRESYVPDFRESETAFLSKMALFRAGSLGCFEGSELCAYVFALPVRGDAVIGVAQVLDALPDGPDTMYVHDMVVAPAHRGRGLASLLLARIADVAGQLGLERFALVAVQGSETFWQRFGFESRATFEYVPGVVATRMVALAPLHLR